MRTKRQAWYGPGFGELAREKIAARWPDRAVLVAVVARFPDAGTKIESIRWYRADARRRGLSVPTDREARAEWPGRREEALREIGRDPLDDEPAEDRADPK